MNYDINFLFIFIIFFASFIINSFLQIFASYYLSYLFSIHHMLPGEKYTIHSTFVILVTCSCFFRDGRIADLGDTNAVESRLSGCSVDTVIDATGKCLFPGVGVCQSLKS